jgi:hypothetical protein
VKRARLLAEEIISRVVGSRGLGNLVDRHRFNGVDKVGELNSILNEEDRNVVANNIYLQSETPLPSHTVVLTIVALVGIQTSGETVDIAGSIHTTSAAGHGRESDKDWSLFASCCQERRSSDVGPVCVRGEHSVCASPSGMDHTFWDLQYHQNRQKSQQTF